MGAGRAEGSRTLRRPPSVRPDLLVNGSQPPPPPPPPTVASGSGGTVKFSVFLKEVCSGMSSTLVHDGRSAVASIRFTFFCNQAAGQVKRQPPNVWIHLCHVEEKRKATLEIVNEKDNSRPLAVSNSTSPPGVNAPTSFFSGR